MSKNTHKRVSVRGSALFGLTSPRRLAEKLLVPRSTLERLVNAGDGNYLVRADRKSGRIIEEPKPQLKLSISASPGSSHKSRRPNTYIQA